MMTAMTSLALLEHTAAATPAFNTAFYATAATVIPVLFLAIVFQNTTWQELAETASTASAGSSTSVKLRIIAWTIGVFVGLVILLGAAGELYAIAALYQQRASGDTPRAVLQALILLTVVIAGIALLPFLRVVREELRGKSAAQQPATGPPGEHHHDTEDGT